MAEQIVLGARLVAFHRGVVGQGAPTLSDNRLKTRRPQLGDIGSMARDHSSLIDRGKIRDRSMVDRQMVAIVAQQ